MSPGKTHLSKSEAQALGYGADLIDPKIAADTAKFDKQMATAELNIAKALAYQTGYANGKKALDRRSKFTLILFTIGGFMVGFIFALASMH